MRLKWQDVVFLFLSTLAGYIEIGFLFLGYALGFSIVQIAILGLTYQIGSLVPNPFNLNKVSIVLIGIVSIFFCLLSIYFSYKEGIFWLLCLSNCMITTNLQALRAQYRLQATDFKKRMFRITGFLCAPFLYLPITVFVAIVLCILAMVTSWKNKKNLLEYYGWNTACALIFVHHLHYFCYVYFLVYTIMHYSATYVMFLYGGFLFAAGWIFYVLVPKINIASSSYYNFMVGHLILAIVLFLGGLYSYKSEVIIFCWILASPFAGTIFNIDMMFAEQYGRKMIRYAEAIGHAGGCILGIIIFFFLKELQYVMYVSALIACYNILQVKKYIVQR